MEFPYYHRSNVSRLEAYRSEIVAMRASNWPFHKITEWLAENHQVKMSKEAVRQFCKVRSIGYKATAASPRENSPRAAKRLTKFEFDDETPILRRHQQ